MAKIFNQGEKFVKAEKLLEQSIKNYPYDPEAKKLLAELKSKRND